MTSEYLTNIQCLRLPAVLKKTTLCKTQLWELIQDGKFPLPVRFSKRVVVWIESEIDQHLNELKDKR